MALKNGVKNIEAKAYNGASGSYRKRVFFLEIIGFNKPDHLNFLGSPSRASALLAFN